MHCFPASDEVRIYAGVVIANDGGRDRRITGTGKKNYGNLRTNWKLSTPSTSAFNSNVQTRDEKPAQTLQRKHKYSVYIYNHKSPPNMNNLEKALKTLTFGNLAGKQTWASDKANCNLVDKG